MDMRGAGARLRELRGGKPAGQVAQAVGISEAALAAYEAGEREPRDEVKLALARHYGLTLEALFFPERA